MSLPCPNPPRGVRPPGRCASTQPPGAIPGASPPPGLRFDVGNFGVVRYTSRERSKHPIFAGQAVLPSTIVPPPHAFLAANCRPSPSHPLPNPPCTNVGAPPSRSHHRRCPVSPFGRRPPNPPFRRPSVGRRFCPSDQSDASHATFGTAPSRPLRHSFRNGRSHSLRPSSHVLRAIFRANDPRRTKKDGPDL